MSIRQLGSGRWNSVNSSSIFFPQDTIQIMIVPEQQSIPGEGVAKVFHVQLDWSKLACFN